MGCRCNERADALRRGAVAAARGDARAAVREAGFVVRTMAQDMRNDPAALARAARARLAQLRRPR